LIAIFVRYNLPSFDHKAYETAIPMSKHFISTNVEDERDLRLDSFDPFPTKIVQHKPWIRGVNLGAWLVFERPFTPYLFAITDCDQRGDFHAFPYEKDAPPNTPTYDVNLNFDSTLEDPSATAWDDSECKPVQPYPKDEWSLASAFENKIIAKEYFTRHWEYFLNRKDMATIKANGATHIRVPLGHWILGDISSDEPYVNGGWPFFLRMVEWAKEEGLEVWPDLHTAPGSQNGFDNSGHLGSEGPSCLGWCDNKANVERTVTIVKNILSAIKDAGLNDVVTGFGPLNEPFIDCDFDTVRQFYNDTMLLVKEYLGPESTVYMGDAFRDKKWNTGWWLDPHQYNNTYLDSHYYHVFSAPPRALSPKQHIALTCQKNRKDTNVCCYQDYEGEVNNTIPSEGISRIIGEWSASFDTLPVDKEAQVMEGIAKTGIAPEHDRQISPAQQAFLRAFTEAQMVTYEAADEGISRGWFFWTFKTQGGALAEWDYLRGSSEGWIAPLLPPNVASVTEFGSCYDILLRTEDDMSVIHEFPSGPADPNNWQGIPITDDVVVSHGESLLTLKEGQPNFFNVESHKESSLTRKQSRPNFLITAAVFVALIVVPVVA